MMKKIECQTDLVAATDVQHDKQDTVDDHKGEHDQNIDDGLPQLGRPVSVIAAVQRRHQPAYRT